MKMLNRKGNIDAGAVLGLVIGIIVAVIGLVIIYNVITNATVGYNGTTANASLTGLSATVATYVAPIFAVGLLALAAMLGYAAYVKYR